MLWDVDGKNLGKFTENIILAKGVHYSINPAAKYVVFRVSSLPLIKARLAGNGCSLVKSRNT
ncbi:MAG: hypothetical protein ABW160_08715, partial [Candidatus Thiodiazotropha sp. 4PDIV1]